MKLVVAISGASGAPYAARLLAFLRDHREIETHVVFTRTGRLVWEDEVGVDPASFGFPIHAPTDMTAPFASGSARFDAMVVIPCSAGQVGRIAHGLSADLVGRAADVMLKERKKLVLVLRESPYSLVHLENMAAVTRAGAVALPASPSFYSGPTSVESLLDTVVSGPTSVESLLDTVVSRVLDHLGIDNALMPRWAGRPRGGTS
jgi:4-hydroxy-3-polyprenylbenzoate decarboxylase